MRMKNNICIGCKHRTACSYKNLFDRETQNYLNVVQFAMFRYKEKSWLALHNFHSLFFSVLFQSSDEML